MAILDFVVPYNSSKDTNEEVTTRIIRSLYVRRLKGGKPVVTFVGGDSGEGKSWAVLRMMEIILKLQDVDIAQVNDIINVHTPLQYPEKLDRLLKPNKFYKDDDIKRNLIKKTNVLAVHEARNLIRSKNWQDFTSQAVADVNAMSRSLKRIAFFIVSQFIRDITTDVRYTLTYYAKCRRPIGKKTHLYFHVMWKDDRDLERPKLRKRRIQGVLVSPTGRRKFITPPYFELNKPPKEITDEFDKEDYEAKGKLIHAIMEKMINKLQAEFDVGGKKIDAMVKWYSDNMDMLRKIGTTTSKGLWKIKADVAKMHDLTPTEFKDFQAALNIKMKNYLRESELSDTV